MKTEKCIKCKKKYKPYMLSNYNLGLCRKCFEKEDKYIERDESVDKVTHKVTCPLCKAKYDETICDKKCKTKGCPVHFFWDGLDCMIFASWLKNEKKQNI